MDWSAGIVGRGLDKAGSTDGAAAGSLGSNTAERTWRSEREGSGTLRREAEGIKKT